MHTIAIRVKSGSSRARVGGRYDGPQGPALIVAVRAPAVDGRATEAALSDLAAALALRPGSLSLYSGPVSRYKIISVTDPPPDLAQPVERLRDARP